MSTPVRSRGWCPRIEYTDGDAHWIAPSGVHRSVANAAFVKYPHNSWESVIAAAKLPFAITHAPGLMLVTDLRNRQLAVL